MMDEQRLKAVIDHANEIGDTAPTLAAYLCATVAEVRRLQQQSQEMAHELTQTARASQHFEQQVTALIAERDAALSERDKWRGVCVDVGRVIDALGKDIVDLPLLVLDAVKQRDAALTEARRVLREVQWDRSGECPLCGGLRDGDTHVYHASHVEVVRGHFPACALAAVLAQEANK